MPPHCDTLDGPVVTAAKEALDKGDVKIILPWAPKEAEAEIKKAFEKTLAVRKLGKEARALADYWFFETVVRLHRASEGASYTGLKPAGLPVGPVLPLAESALETGSSKKLVEFLSKTVAKEVNERLERALERRKRAGKSVEANREYVEAMLELDLWCHHLYLYLKGDAPHDEE